MRTRGCLTFAVVLLAAIGLNRAAPAGEQANMAHAHIGHVMDSFKDTPNQHGLLPAALAEAKTAAQHAGLAAKADGASGNVKTHATHVSASANNVIKWADEIVSLAQKIRAAGSAAGAAQLVSQLATLAEQLTAGVDANKDGRITWDTGEGGLQQAQQHMQLMKKGEGLP